MTILYNCRHDGDQYRITKFDSDMNVVSSYLCSLEECDCPRGSHPTCRHRQMLPKFISRQHIGDEWFFDFDRGGWVQGEAHWAQEPLLHITLEGPITMGADGAPHLHSISAADERPPSPKHIPRRL